MDIDRRQLQEILEFAIESAQLAGAFTLGYFNAGTPHEMKADNTPVTVADRGAEQRLRHRIEKAFPRHGILGEEFGEKRGEDPARWIIDPIDGTISFISGVPLYSVLVGFEWRGEMLAGVIHLPALHETVYAARGLGCWWNGRRARVSDVDRLDHAVLLSAGAKGIYEHGRGNAYERLRDACYADRGWCDAYGYALLATGRAEIMLDPAVSLWDLAAVIPIIQEAGGRIGDWAGGSIYGATECVATTARLHEPVLTMIRASASA